MTQTDDARGPERIFATGDGINGSWTTREVPSHWGAAATEYIRADLATQPVGAVKVKPLVWEDFDGRGAKSSAFYSANYLINLWNGRGQFEVSLSYPGHQTGYDGERWHDTLEAAKAAAQADYEARILSALEHTQPDPLADPRVTALVNLIRQAQGIIDPCYPAKHAAWQNATRATLAAFDTTTGGNADG